MNKNIDVPGEWWTAPAEADNGQLVIVTGRSDIGRFRSNPRFNIRVEVSWKYAPSGMPPETGEIASTLEAADQGFHRVLGVDPVAVLTGIFTGDGERTWVFYTLSTAIFQKKLNEALAPLPLLPLRITAENDPRWEAYDEMEQARVEIDA